MRKHSNCDRDHSPERSLTVELQPVNALVKGTKTSAHCLGHAADFHVEGLSDLDAAKRIRDSELKFDQLIFEKGRCVHISFDPRLRGQVKRQPGGPNTKTFPGLEG